MGTDRIDLGRCNGGCGERNEARLKLSNRHQHECQDADEDERGRSDRKLGDLNVTFVEEPKAIPQRGTNTDRSERERDRQRRREDPLRINVPKYMMSDISKSDETLSPTTKATG